MNFLYPLFLVAALTLAIPVIIHLFNFRKFKKVLFPDIRFLREIQEQTRKSSRLKHLLILAARLLAIACLVLAFAQPFLEKDRAQAERGPGAFSIYIDNSFSMGLEEGGLPLFDQARAKARSIIEAGSSQDVFQVLTNDFGFNENRFLPRAEALQHLGGLTLSPRKRDAAAVLEKQRLLLQTEPAARKSQVFISDFQRSGFPAGLQIEDATPKIFYRTKAEGTPNLSIDTLAFDSPTLQLNQPNPLRVKVKNRGESEAQTSLTLLVNGQLKSVVNLSLKAGEERNEALTFTTATAGPQRLSVFLQDHPLSFDDTFYAAGEVRSQYAVMVLNQGTANAFLSSVFRPGGQFRVDHYQVSTVQPALLKNYSLIVLNGATNISAALSEALKTWVEQGGSLLVFPPASGPVQGLNGLLNELGGVQYGRIDTARATVSDYNRNHELFRDLFEKTPENIELPQVNRHYLLQASSLNTQQKLFSFSTGDVFLGASRCGNGKLYVCTSAAETAWSNFPKSYWFLPLLYKMAFSNSMGGAQALTLGRGGMLQLPMPSGGERSVVHLIGRGTDAIPEQRPAGQSLQVDLNRALQQAGHYALVVPGSRDSVLVGVNYDRSESDLRYWTTEELKSSSRIAGARWEEDLQAAAGPNDDAAGMPLWKVCIILALLFLLAEMLLIRLLK